MECEHDQCTCPDPDDLREWGSTHEIEDPMAAKIPPGGYDGFGFPHGEKYSGFGFPRGRE